MGPGSILTITSRSCTSARILGGRTCARAPTSQCFLQCFSTTHSIRQDDDNHNTGKEQSLYGIPRGVLSRRGQGGKLHPPRLQDQVAIVTGSSSGLGRAIALQFASHGAKLVVCVDLDNKPSPDGVESESTPTHILIKQTYGQSTAAFVHTDVTVASSVENMVAKVVEVGRHIDILVNCAGLGSASGSPELHNLEEQHWDKVMNVNLKGTFLTNKYVLRQMIKQHTAWIPSASTRGLSLDRDHPLARRGTIINVSSMLSTIALPNGTAAYCASKGAVLNLTKQLALDYAKYKITVNALCPGFTKTAMTQGNWSNEKTNQEMINATPMGGWGRAEDVARMAVSLASEDAAWMTGAQVVVDGGYSAQ